MFRRRTASATFSIGCLIALAGFAAAFMVSGSAAGDRCQRHGTRCQTTTQTSPSTTTTADATTTRTTTTTPTTTSVPTTTRTTTTVSTTTATTVTTTPAPASPVAFDGAFRHSYCSTPSTAAIPSPCKGQSAATWLGFEDFNWGSTLPLATTGQFSVHQNANAVGGWVGETDLPGSTAYQFERGETVSKRPTPQPGDNTWYTFGYEFPSGWDPLTGGCIISQFLYQGGAGIGGPTLALKAINGHVDFLVQAGLTHPAPNAYQYNSNNTSVVLPHIDSYTTPGWHEIVVGVHSATDASGSLTAMVRVNKGPWQTTVPLQSGFATMQIDTLGNYPATILTKQGPYCYAKSTPRSLRYGSYSISSSRAAALAFLGP